MADKGVAVKEAPKMATKEQVRAAEDSAAMANSAETVQQSHCTTDAFKFGGTTAGTIAIGTAIGSFFSPAGAAAGALIGGVTGVVISSIDARNAKSK